MRFAVKDHLGESHPMVNALLDAGHEMSADGPTDLFLIDLDPDPPEWGYRTLIDFYRECGAVVLQYPHGAPASTLQYDNLYEPYEKVDGQLTNGQGEIDYFRAIGLERPARIMGWQLCKQFEFRASTEPRRVTFAPTHVNADGSLNAERRETNKRIFHDLLEANYDLTVRYIGDLEKIGLWADERVFRWVQGNLDMSTVEIDSADCVVAGVGTYSCLAIARGVPTVMYGQFQASMYGYPNEKPKPLRQREKYEHIVKYPIDVDLFTTAPQSIQSLVYYACDPKVGEDAIRAWRTAWIGDPFQPREFVTMVEEWIPELREARGVLSSVR